jgi:hypothetical protein
MLAQNEKHALQVCVCACVLLCACECVSRKCISLHFVVFHVRFKCVLYCVSHCVYVSYSTYAELIITVLNYGYMRLSLRVLIGVNTRAPLHAYYCDEIQLLFYIILLSCVLCCIYCALLI